MSAFVQPRPARAAAVATVTAAVAAAAALLLWGAGCTEPEASGPPTIRAGEDTCAECGMSIVQTQFAAAALCEEDGHAVHALFDDVGCLLIWQAARTEARPPRERWVIGLDSRTWVPLEAAHFLVGSTLHTPMDFKVVAFASLDAARDAQASKGGTVMPPEELSVPRIGSNH